ncbi:MAG: hypothetical protein V7752_20075 [Halopseudomonas sp.]
MSVTHKKYLALIIAGALSSAAHAESFRDALQGGKFSGDINNVYASGSKTDAIGAAGPNNNSNVGSSALSIAYKTSSYKGLTFGINFQQGKDWRIHDDSVGLAGEDDSRNSISSTNLQNLYMDYSFDPSITKTGVRIGRQDIISPLIMRSSMFPMKDAFDALVITNKDLADTTLKVMYIQNWIKRYGHSASASPVQQDAEFDGSLYSIYLNNNSIQGLNIEGQWMSNNSEHTKVGDPPTNVVPSGPYDTSFLALTYKVPDTNIVLGAKNLTANYDNSANSDYWGLKAGTKFAGVGVTLAHTSVDDANNLPGTLGHVPLFRGYHKTITTAEFKAGVDTTSLSFNYNFDIKGLKSYLTYASWSQSDKGIAISKADLDGTSELALDISYRFQNIAGLSTRIQLSQIDYDLDDGDSDFTYLRMHLKYQF